MHQGAETEIGECLGEREGVTIARVWAIMPENVPKPLRIYDRTGANPDVILALDLGTLPGSALQQGQ